MNMKAHVIKMTTGTEELEKLKKTGQPVTRENLMPPPKGIPVIKTSIIK